MKQNKKSAKHHKKLKENPNEYNYQFSNSNILSSSSSTSEFKTVLTNKALLDSFPNAKQDKIKELRNGMKNEIKSNKSEIDNNKSPQIIDSPFLTLIPISNHKNIKSGRRILAENIIDTGS